MKTLVALTFWCVILKQGTSLVQSFDDRIQIVNTEKLRNRRDVIEEEKFYNIRTETRKDIMRPTQWLPGGLPTEEPTTKNSYDPKQALPLYQTTEKSPEKATNRGARASNEKWIKLPYLDQDEQERDVLTPPKPSGELLNSRMPRVNFVTQNKPLQTSELRNEKEPISPRNDDFRQEKAKQNKPLIPRQAEYYPEESRKTPSYDGYYDDYYRRDPYYDITNPPLFKAYPKIDRFDDTYDNYLYRKPKRIIYYAHLPDVVRSPPSVDLRYRYTMDPFRRFDNDFNTRSGRFDYRFRNRYPYSPYRKDDRYHRDLIPSATVNNDKKNTERPTVTPAAQKKEDKVPPSTEDRKPKSNQYHDKFDLNINDRIVGRYPSEDIYLRYDEPLFERAIDTYRPY